MEIFPAELVSCKVLVTVKENDLIKWGGVIIKLVKKCKSYL